MLINNGALVSSKSIDKSQIEDSPDDDHFKQANLYIGSKQPQTHNRVKRLVYKYINIFREYCVTKEQANVTPEKLPLKADAVPQMCPIFAKKPEIHEEVEEFAAKLVQRGLTKEQHSNWRANIVLLKKKNSTKWFAIDYRRLKEQSTTISYQCL